jgi:mannose-6-phosphate isomerase
MRGITELPKRMGCRWQFSICRRAILPLRSYLMAHLPPLQFKPIFRDYLWGGRRLAAELGKALPAGTQVAESWEIVDHGQDQSVVADGPLAGATLHKLVADHSEEIFGRHPPGQQFPLLLKFLDAQKTLSVQVHPNDEQAARLDPPDLGKTEAWVVLAAEPGAKIWAGLKQGVNRSRLTRAVADGACEECLHEFEPVVGDAILIEAGTVHAIGAGLVLAEIQQASDTTYRLFDWNRLDRDGKPRTLHVEQALGVINYERGPVNPGRPQATDRAHIERLAACDKFVLDRWRLAGPVALETDRRFHILAVVEGGLTASAAGVIHRLQRGSTMFVPACCGNVQLAPQGRGVLLDMYLP